MRHKLWLLSLVAMVTLSPAPNDLSATIALPANPNAAGGGHAGVICSGALRAAALLTDVLQAARGLAGPICAPKIVRVLDDH